MSGKKSPYPDGRIPDRQSLMAHLLFPGEAAGLKAFFPSGLLPLQVEWLFCLLWVCSSTAPTPVLVPPDFAHRTFHNRPSGPVFLMPSL